MSVLLMLWMLLRFPAHFEKRGFFDLEEDLPRRPLRYGSDGMKGTHSFGYEAHAREP